jgi:hypothetical protein
VVPAFRFVRLMGLTPVREERTLLSIERRGDLFTQLR